MKSFSQFIHEAVETIASTEAKNRGLVGNGHGDWYDAQGNFVAKTIKGKLKFFGQGDTVSKDGIPGEEIKLQPKERKNKLNSTKERETENKKEPGVTVVFGRFNPPSKNHESLLKFGFDDANRMNYEYRIYPSRIYDGQRNPLNPKTKIEFMKMIYDRYSDYIVDSEDSRTIFDVLTSLYEDGYKNVNIIVGQERLSEFQNLANRGQGQLYNFENIEVISFGGKDPDDDIESPGSSAMMRASASIKDFTKFSQGLPSRIKISDRKKIFNSLVNSLEVNEDTEIWKLSSNMDYDSLRWNYKNNNLFEVGSYIESMSSGLVGKVMRRGANYLICITEDGIMFKSWLTDVHEVYEIGTPEYREHAQKITPGQPVVSFVDDKKIINSSRKMQIKRNETLEKSYRRSKI